MALQVLVEKQLAQVHPGVTTPVTIYTCPANTITIIKELIIANVGGSNRTFSLFHDDSGTTYDETTALVLDGSLPKDESVSGVAGTGFVAMSAGGTIGFEISTANDATITLYGAEITES